MTQAPQKAKAWSITSRILLAPILAISLFLFACAAQKPSPPPAPPAEEAPLPVAVEPLSTPVSTPEKAAQTPKKQPAKKSAPRPVPPTAQLKAHLSPKDTAEEHSTVDFALPAVAWAGEPFLLKVSGKEIISLKASWRGKQVQVAAGKDGQKENSCELAFAVPLGDKTKDYKLELTLQTTDGSKTTYAVIPVRNRSYPVQKLQVAQKYVTPDPSVQDRIKRDRQEIAATIRKVTPVKHWTTPFQRPVPGSVSSVFGLRRVFNGQPRNPHKGVDFRAAHGSPVAAIESGTVALVADHYYGGNTVIIDHGLGLYSFYLHLSGFNVTQGQQIARGDTIGFIGSTGRSTGPHLHLSMSVLGDSVDAASLIAGMQKKDK